jgi:hypothetical protein
MPTWAGGGGGGFGGSGFGGAVGGGVGAARASMGGGGGGRGAMGGSSFGSSTDPLTGETRASPILDPIHLDEKPNPPVLAQAAGQLGPGLDGYHDNDDLPIEICFVLDTTGSMGPLINGAREKIWSIANDIVKETPQAPLKFGLVAYRDRKDTYITKTFDLTDDLDAMYRELQTYKAQGGGDQPESVNQALDDAVNNMTWSDKKTRAIRLIFLVGDSPPHMDYPDDVKYPDTVAAAVKKGIIIDTIQCGKTAATTPIWKEIALQANGMFMQLGQDGSITQVRTPQDAELVELTGKLAMTVLPYGNAAQQAAVREKAGVYKYMGAEAVASRAAVNIAQGGKVVQGKGDLIQDMKVDKNLLASLKPEDLPEELRNLTPEGRQAYIHEQAEKRNAINDQVAKVAAERYAFVKSEAARTPPPAAGGTTPTAPAGSPPDAPGAAGPGK